MALDDNIDLVDTEPQDILLGSSTSFIVQNTSNVLARFKVKGSTKQGGILKPAIPYEFDYDIEVWTTDTSTTYPVNLYIIRA